MTLLLRLSWVVWQVAPSFMYEIYLLVDLPVHVALHPEGAQHFPIKQPDQAHGLLGPLFLALNQLILIN